MRPRRRLLAVAALAALATVWAVAALLLWRSRIPGDLHLPHSSPREYFSAAELHRTSRYERFVRIDSVLAELALLVALAVYASRGARLARESAAGRIGTGMLLGMLGFAVVWLAQLPFGLAELWWERRHGVSRESYLGRLVGNWLGLGSEFLFICLAILIVMALAAPLRQRWWIAGGPAFVALGLLFAFAQPYLIPGVHPLRNQALAAEARRLARAEGVAGTPVEVQVVHTFTTAPNAEAAGLGPSRRVILWDTLLDGRFGRGEIRFVLAHELGHLARGHIWKGLAWYALFALPGAFLIAAGTRRRGSLYEPPAVPLALLVLVVLELAAQPLQNVVARHLEAEADWVALQTTRDPSSARALFRRFTATSLAEPSPPTWDYLLFENHPTIIRRIAMVEAWRARRGPR